ncbi:MAG: OFA family MFS transporter [Desulfobacteraceae bacterium]|nr:OFA family MFS transporter [Desulfobacteraceae bacterium]
MEKKNAILCFACITIFFPGAFVFGFPGVMAAQWQHLFSVNQAAIGQLMFFVLVGSGFSMFIAGRLQEKISTHWIVFCGSFACGILMFFAGRASSMAQINLWAFLTGFFASFVYVPSLSLFQTIFPQHRGLVSGIFNMTFGGAAVFLAPVFSHLLVLKGYAFTANFAALLCLFIGTTAAWFVRQPIKDKKRQEVLPPTLSATAILKQKNFWMLWLVWAFCGAAGISMVVLCPLFGKALGYDVNQYVYILVGFNLCNGVGRLLVGKLSDIYSKQAIMMITFVFAGIAFFLLPFLDNLSGICFLSGIIGLAFGTLFTVSAPLITEVYGPENFGRIFGLVFTAYGFVAGLIGPWLSGVILDITGSDFKPVFFYLGLFFLVSSFLILNIKKNFDKHTAVSTPRG